MTHDPHPTDQGKGRGPTQQATRKARLTSILGVVVLLTACSGGSAKTGSSGASASGSQESVASSSAASSSAPSVTSTSTAPAASPPSAGASHAAGTWNGTWKSDKYSINGTFQVTLNIAGESLAGDITVDGSQCITRGTVTGSVDGSTISFGAVQASNSVAYTGTISGASMVGTYTTPCGNDSGTWSASR